MGVGLSSMAHLTGTLTGAALAVSKISEDLSKEEKEEPKAEQKESGIDAKMAAKARKIAQQKINAIYQNKELSNKAKTRRMGVVMDEYNEIIGGNR